LRIKILVFIITIGCFRFSIGQEVAQAKPYSFEFAGGVATFRLQGQSLDEAWSASIKLFMTQNTKGYKRTGPAVTPDKPSGTMSGAWFAGKGILKYATSLSLLFESQDGAVVIYCTPSGKPSLTKKHLRDAAQNFFDKLTATLYGEGEPIK
jgi:hypothetical protein